jgi:hypothetical protein
MGHSTELPGRFYITGKEHQEMGVLPDREGPADKAAGQAKERRWLDVLEEVVEERQTGRPWWYKVGLFLAWAAGFALTAGLAATVVLALVELFKGGRQFTGRTLSDYIFWASALLMLVGFLTPASTGLQETKGKQQKEKDAPREGRSTTILRKRMRRMYDPWRWRIWAGAALCFGLSALVGLAAMP